MKAGKLLKLSVCAAVIVAITHVPEVESQIVVTAATSALAAAAAGYAGLAAVAAGTGLAGAGAGALAGSLLRGNNNNSNRRSRTYRYTTSSRRTSYRGSGRSYYSSRGKRQAPEPVDYNLEQIENVEDCLKRFYCEMALVKEEFLLPREKILMSFVKNSPVGQASPAGKIVGQTKPGVDTISNCQKRFKFCEQATYDALKFSIEDAA